MMGAEKWRVMRGEKISFSKGGGNKFNSRTEIKTPEQEEVTDGCSQYADPHMV
jgi:hypothetical protein